MDIKKTDYKNGEIMKEKTYDSYKYRCGNKALYTETEQKLMEVLMDFGESIDQHGYDDGAYKEAILEILKITNIET